MMIDTSGIPAFDTTNVIGERYILKAEEELRCEFNFSASVKKPIVQITLQKGSCEVFGSELALHKTYTIGGGPDDVGFGLQVAFFTWYGAVLDITANQDGIIEMPYTSDETSCNIAYVNTHAQLEVLRDDAVQAATSNNKDAVGPRVLICGPKECGKSSLVRVLTAYACKLGRTPIVVDLDPADNGISIPGTLCACPFDQAAITVDMYTQNCMTPSPLIPAANNNNNNTTSSISSTIATPLSLWHGNVTIQDDLYKAQTAALAEKIQQRYNAGDDWGRSSGIIINTNSSIQEEKQYPLLLHTIQTFQVNVVLVLGHDRLYSMLKNSTASMTTGSAAPTTDPASTTTTTTTTSAIKVIKVPRSGGVVTRDAKFIRQLRSRAIKRYFYGTTIDNKTAGTDASGASAAAAAASNNATTTTTIPDRVSQLTPFLIQISYTKLTLYKLSSISLSASLLPVAQAQSTEPIQIQEIHDITEKLQHTVLGVCHPSAVAAYDQSGRARDLYNAGVAGFVAVERVLVDTEMIHLLAPCAGSLPSYTLLLGDNLTWMD